MFKKMPSEKLRYEIRDSDQSFSAKKKLPRHKPGEKFLKGPIPLVWLEAAAKLPGKALHVGIEIWFWAGIKGPEGIKLSTASLIKFGVERHSAYRAVNALENAGLISVIRHKGRKPIVSLIDSPGKD